jgi:hypothetical protein
MYLKVKIQEGNGECRTATLIDVSLSGAFLEMAEPRGMLNIIKVIFADDANGNLRSSMVKGHVVRVAAAGVGIEWFRFAPPEIRRRLEPSM